MLPPLVHPVDAKGNILTLESKFQDVLVVERISDYAHNQLVRALHDPKVLQPMMVGKYCRIILTNFR